jgi:hypothetical protein
MRARFAVAGGDFTEKMDGVWLRARLARQNEIVLHARCPPDARLIGCAAPACAGQASGVTKKSLPSYHVRFGFALPDLELLD